MIAQNLYLVLWLAVFLNTKPYTASHQLTFFHSKYFHYTALETSSIFMNFCCFITCKKIVKQFLEYMEYLKKQKTKTKQKNSNIFITSKKYFTCFIINILYIIEKYKEENYLV